MELEHPLSILLCAFDELKVSPFVSLQNEFVKPIGAMLRSFSRLALPTRMVSIKMLQWLDGVRTPPKYLIVCVRQTLSLTICVFTE